jgi:hypothetical protein
MAKKVLKKVQAPVVAVPVAPVVQASVGHPVPGDGRTGRKLKVNDTPDEANARWARRLARWQGKAEKAGVDARALMEAALAA